MKWRLYLSLHGKIVNNPTLLTPKLEETAREDLMALRKIRHMVRYPWNHENNNYDLHVEKLMAQSSFNTWEAGVKERRRRNTSWRLFFFQLGHKSLFWSTFLIWKWEFSIHEVLAFSFLSREALNFAKAVAKIVPTLHHNTVREMSLSGKAQYLICMEFKQQGKWALAILFTIIHGPKIMYSKISSS